MSKINKPKSTVKTIPKSEFWKNKYLPCFYILFIMVIYGNTFNHGFVLDDDIVYKKNEFVLKGFNGIGDIFSHGFLYGFNKENDQSYRPLTLTSFAIENQFFNGSSKASHFIHVLLYTLACFILLKLLLEIFNKTPLLAYLIALIFASHPIHTEVVANIKSRDELLSFLFAVLCLFYLFKYLNTSNISKLFFSITAFILALLSKENSLPLIAVIPVFIYVFTEKKIKINIMISTIFVIISVFYIVMRMSILSTMGFVKDMDIINNALMASTNKADELATIFYILANYLKLLIIPYPLSFDYSYNYFPIVSWTNIVSIFSLLIYLGIGVFAVLRIRKKQADGFGLFSFLALFSISTNIFVKIGTTLGERLLFTPSLGFIIAVMYFLWQKFGTGKAKTNLAIISFSIILIFSFLTYQRNKDWKSNLTLFESSLDSFSNSARVQSAVASEYRAIAEMSNDVTVKSKYFEKAIDHYQKAIDIYPKYKDAFYNMGVSYQSLGMNDMAVKAYKNTLKIYKEDVNSLNNLGSIYFNDNQLDTAMKFFMTAYQIDSLNPNILGNIGSYYHNKGNYKEAINFYEKSLTYNNNSKNIITYMIMACKSINDTIRLKKYESMQ